MELVPISQVSKELGISTRTLRYYEQKGLIVSERCDSSGYRMYDSENLTKIVQIVFLRKLQIPLRDIGELLESHSLQKAIDILSEKVNELSDDIGELGLLKQVLNDLIGQLKQAEDTKKLPMFTVEQTSTYLSSLKEIDRQKERRATMEQLNKNKAPINRMNIVRVLTLPPMKVASVRCVSLQPEEEAQKKLDQFILDSGLLQAKPDFRVFGFNSPNPTEPMKPYGYELWVSVPEDFLITGDGIQEKRIEGGQYAAVAIQLGDFFGWDVLLNWVEKHPQYKRRMAGDDSNMTGLLEEPLNYYGRLTGDSSSESEVQLDLLMPIEEK